MVKAGGEGGCEEVKEDKEDNEDVDGDEDRARRGVPMLPIPEEDDDDEEEEEDELGEGDEGEEAPLEDEEEEEAESLRWNASASSRACICPSISTVASCSDLTTASLAGSLTWRHKDLLPACPNTSAGIVALQRHTADLHDHNTNSSSQEETKQNLATFLKSYMDNHNM